MRCVKIRRNLSAYIEKELDADTTNMVAQHLLSCNACKDAFNALHRLLQELSVMEKVKAPDDFLDSLQARIKKDSIFGGLARSLRVPSGVKFLLQFGAAAAMAGLLFFIVRSPEIKRTMQSAPVGMQVERESTAGQSELPVKSAAVDEKPESPPLIEIALLLPGQLTERRDVFQTFMESEAGLTKKVLKSRKQNVASPASEIPEVLGSAAALSTSDIDKIVRKIKGRVVKIEYNSRNNRPKMFTVEIPAHEYENFLNALQGLGKLRRPPAFAPAPKSKLAEVRVRVLVHVP
jgi:hypothetical protein